MIISAVREIVTEGGLCAVSAREIAKRINYSTGSIYSIFTSLNELIFHVEIEFIESMKKSLNEITYDEDPSKQLFQFTEAYINFVCDNFNLWHLVVEHRLYQVSDLPDTYSDKLNQIYLLAMQRLEPFIAKDNQESPKDRTFVFLSGLNGVIIYSYSNKLDLFDKNKLHKYGQYWVKNFISGLDR